ncbi:MAG: hypothetical protein A2Z62_01290 [Candidatus Terrybacteria bacterium RIFCSPLOWO2_02_42_20]|uniref:Uncharacterized protein n=2 Tax=Candidatus Terryibacteriota TaxID=1817920 RepID=A0A1G2PQL7_9BACT|nr:MAG: hypothetical protein A2W59_01520 [Candidatus Terrybacteria bacterium RIFCSPHIGHO2_02_41_19]OHA54453.1 MAG: hypothetical protein A2Z62_01290 [Candidatus Terrybacteria bacterium RIFCSPLOWO2_02_42_20]
MDITNEERKIKIRKIQESAEIEENLKENGVIKKGGKFFNFEKLSAFVFCALVFLAPVFATPLAVAPVASGKSILFFGGIFLSAFFFILSAIQKGSVKILKSALLISCGAIVLVWLISALFSGNIGLSLAGKLYDLDTFSAMFTAGLALFLGSMIFQSKKRVFVFYLLLFLSSFIAFLFQLLHLVFGINIIPFNVFPYATSNLIGGWNDFSIFFGLVGLISLVFLETANSGKGVKFFLYAVLTLSFLAMVASNFSGNWIIFGAFSLFVFVITLFKKPFGDKDGGADGVKRTKIIRASFFAIILVLFFILFKGTAGKINDALGTSFSGIRPSWQTTIDIAKQSLKSDIVLGTGPNTFLYDWLKFKPAAINDTIFWNARFSSGFGYLPSMMATTGILGIAAIIIFLIIFLIYGKKILSYKENDPLTVVSFLGAAYLWTFVVLYTPGLLIFEMAFIMTGVFLALLANNGKIGVAEIFLSGLSADRQDKAKSRVIFMIMGIILLIGTVFLFYLYSRKFLALNNYSQAIVLFEKSGDIDATGKKLMKAVQMDKQDEYYRALSELGLVSLGQIAVSKDISADKAVALFQNNLSSAIVYAREATRLNPADPVNWMQLGRVYESVVAFKVGKADEAAINSYREALKASPLDPSPFIALARVAMQTQKIDDAKKYLQSALNIKPDFADALFAFSQIEAQTGNLKEAILRMEQAAATSPNNFGVFFRLGLLQYQNNNFNAARTAFEKTVGLNNGYANARYFLGLIYDKQGLKEKAIEQFVYIQKTNPANEEVKKILSNLKNGRSALAEIAPPAPEKRKEPPISEKEQTSPLTGQTDLKSKKK